jgi:AraC-like DNA-binding protein
MPARPLPSPPPLAGVGGLLSQQVAGSRYIFLNLAPGPRERWALAMAGREECRPDYVVDRPSYPFHVIELIVRGAGHVRLGTGKRQRVTAGTVFSCAAGRPCYIAAEPADPLVKFFFALHGRDVPARLTESGLAAGTVRHIALPTEALAVAEEIIREGQRHHPAAPALCLKLLELLLLRLATSHARAAAPADERARDSFARGKALIDAEAATLQTLEDIAARVHLAPSTVCRLFRRFQGVSPYQYLMRRKMTLAAEHLLDRGALVKEAAARVGFQDPFHFSRCFKAVHGVPPTALRSLANSASATGA